MSTVKVLVDIVSDTEIERPNDFFNFNQHSQFVKDTAEESLNKKLENIDLLLEEIEREMRAEKIQLQAPFTRKFTEVNSYSSRMNNVSILRLINLPRDEPDVFSPIIEDVNVDADEKNRIHNIVQKSAVIMSPEKD